MTTSGKRLKISVPQDDSKCSKGISSDLVINVAAKFHLFSPQIFPRNRTNGSCIIGTVDIFMLVDSTFCIREREGRRERAGESRNLSGGKFEVYIIHSVNRTSKILRAFK